MIESADRIDPLLKIPVHSLYGETRIPTDEMFDGIDLLLIDLQDIGTRVYTFITTMALCMEAARRCGRSVMVLDRPNPVGGSQIEGRILNPAFSSFVGKFPIPMRHGMTMAELALLFNESFGIGCDLSVVPMRGWRRNMRFGDTGLPWVAPSPNMPTPASAAVYPGQVLWEGTTVSEGRGTTLPFELFGAPFMDPEAVAARIPGWALDGIVLRPAAFEPTWNKWAGELCFGFQIHVQDPDGYRPLRSSLALLSAVRELYPERFGWKPPPYEYEYDRLPVDLILGGDEIRRALEEGAPVGRLTADWEKDEETFAEIRQPYLLYR